MLQQSSVGQGILLIEGLRLHTDTPHLVGLLWTSDQLYSGTCTWQHTTLATSMCAAEFEPAIPASGRWQNHVLDRAATGIDNYYIQKYIIVNITWENRREREHWGDLGVDGWIILGWISRRWDVDIWTGLGWSRIETGGGRLWVR